MKDGDAKKVASREVEKLADIARHLWEDVPVEDRLNFRELSAIDPEDRGYVPGLTIVQISKKDGRKAHKRVRVWIGQNYELPILKTEFDTEVEHQLIPLLQQVEALDRYIAFLSPRIVEAPDQP